MPGTKLAFLRYLLIDQMLRSKFKKYPTKEELLEACNERFGVSSVSTIEKDLNAMRVEFDAPIVYNAKSRGYEYSDKQYKFLSHNLSDDNLLALGFVGTLLRDFRELPIFAEFSDAVDKVLDGVEITRLIGSSKQTSNLRECVQIDKMRQVQGSENLSRVMQAVLGHEVLAIDYKKFGSDVEKAYTIHPYLLKEYKTLWYLVGYVPVYNEVRVFGIDRICAITPAPHDFIAPEKVGFDAENFYKYCLGVSVLSDTPEEVRLHVVPSAAPYIKAQPIHHSQQIIAEDAGGCTVSLLLVVNYELRREILSYGAQMRVLAPAHLAEQVCAESKQMLRQYTETTAI